MGGLFNLRILDLSRNDLSGAIPPELGTLSNLESLYLGNNQLSGEIPPSFTGLLNLSFFHFQDNDGLCGLPNDLLQNWFSAITYRNPLTFPVCTGGKYALAALYEATEGDNWTNNDGWLSNRPLNEWYGVAAIGDDVRNVVLNDNNLIGAIHPDLGSIPSLKWLVLRGNQLSGEIPPELGDLPELSWLDLSRNDLSGEIPPELGGLSNLEYLYLSSNNLTGRIPPELGGLSKLRSLNLHANQLSGALPQILTRLTALKQLWTTKNIGLCTPRDDEFRAWLETVPSRDLKGHCPDPASTATPATPAPTETPAPEPTPEPLPPAPCMEAFTGDGTFNARWTNACYSENRYDSYAGYYAFSLSERSKVTISLESATVDTYLVLRSGVVKRGRALRESDDLSRANTNSGIVMTLDAGEYTIEATAVRFRKEGDYTLRVNIGPEFAPPPPDPCEATELSGDGTVSGNWTSDCASQHKPGSYARYYTFNMSRAAVVTITLESATVDTYLSLRGGKGSSRSGWVYDDDDFGGTTNSQVVVRLVPGPYTVEATTDHAGQTGDFTLTVSAAPAPTPTPEPTPVTATACETALPSGNVAVSGSWTSDCVSQHKPGSYARYFTFNMSRAAVVTITLESATVDTYLSLRGGKGSSRSGWIYDDDDFGGTTNSQVVVRLVPGPYTVEATTDKAGKTGDFQLTVRGSDAPVATSAPVATPTPDPAETPAPTPEPTPTPTPEPTPTPTPEPTPTTTTITATACETALPSGNVTVNGSWASGCDSKQQSGSYARYFTFNMSHEAAVTIILEGPQARLYLYGTHTVGTVSNPQRIAGTLAPRKYKIEATTLNPGRTGNFKLTVRGIR